MQRKVSNGRRCCPSVTPDLLKMFLLGVRTALENIYQGIYFMSNLSMVIKGVVQCQIDVFVT